MRVVFALPFDPNRITGGQKSIYTMAALLAAAGVDAAVWQPSGRPTWFETRGPHLSVLPDLDGGDLVVVPEDVPQSFVVRIFGAGPARLVLLCLNPYTYLTVRAQGRSSPPVRWTGALVVGRRYTDLIRRLEGLDIVVSLIPSIDPALFRPSEKSLRICAVPRKLPCEFMMIGEIFRSGHPDVAETPVDVLSDATEAETASAMGRASVFLSLCHREALALTPLEAMASGCVVVGYHGDGVLNYATAANGLWFGFDDVEAVADALARTVRAVRDGELWVDDMRAAGAATAAAFTAEAASASLVDAIRWIAAAPALQ